MALLGWGCAGPSVGDDAYNVPFVGCLSSGWNGDAPAPRAGPVPAGLSPRAVASLAYYSDGSTAVLAPRGWHCLSMWDSSGGSFLVTPDRSALDAFYHMRRDKRPVFGVQLTYRHGGTSGRFAVADAIARLFPEHMEFARRVAAEEIADPLPAGPYPDDRIARVNGSEIEFTTPANAAGMGTEASRLALAPYPIRGMVILYAEQDMLMMQLSYRLPPTQSHSADTIREQVRQSSGVALGERRASRPGGAS